MDFKNLDLTSGPVIADLNSADASAALDAAATLAVALQAGNILPLTADGQLVLPAGVGLDDIKVVGRDLVIQMPDGTQMIVPDGAIFVPQIVVDGVAVPPLNIAALLIGQEPQPAAGRTQSSGGNFADPVGDIGDPFGLGDLLPPTQLAFPEPEEREIIPALNDEEPTTIIVTPDQPAGSVSATASVNEAALPARGSEPAGSNEASNAETTTGSIVFDAPDGLSSITLNGVAITAVGQVFVTPLGSLTITSIATGNIGYSYTLTDNTVNPASNDMFAVVVTDSDGDTASANLTINIVDDAPTARNDTDAVAAGTYGPQTGNVVTGAGTTSGAAGADTTGADGAAVSGVRAGSEGNFGSVGSTINGQYGTLTLNADGSYSYTRGPNTPGGVTDTFSYQITDGDGDTSTATLVISIGDSPATVISVPSSEGGTIVDEEGLPPRGTESPGSNAPAPVEATSGTIGFAAPDGVATVQINGTTVTGPGQVITLPTGTFTVTSYDPVGGTLGYTFTLTDNTSGDSTTQVITVTVTDIDGDSDSEPFTITIIDDTPTARDDSATQETENAPVTVDVFANDTPGADGVNLTSGVAIVAESLTGAGTLVYNGDGTFTYTPAAGEENPVSFQYTITDGDGDPSTATVTINLLEDSTPALEIGGERLVAEAGLPARGSDPAGSDSESNTETTTGAIFVSTGNDTVQSLVINGINVTSGGTVAGAHGTLIVSLSEGAYSYSYTLTDNTSGDATTDSFDVVLTDSDGDVANDTLVIDITDDVPTAVLDSDTIAAGQYGPATGNVITDTAAGDEGDSDSGADTQGADGATVTAVFGTADGTVGGSTAGQYGVLTLNADGSYSYVRNAGTPGGVPDIFTYSITDSDGDPSVATLTINIADSLTSLDLPADGEAGTEVDEAGLPAGSQAATDGEITNGTIAYTAPDGPATVTIDGVAVTAVGQLFSGSFGTLKITSIANGSIGYEYTLTTNTSGDNTSDDFAIVVTDQDGDNTPGTLIIDIVDDVPTAVADEDSVTEDDFSGVLESVSADGNVLTGVGGSDANGTDGVADTKGADGATVTAVAFDTTPGVEGGLVAGVVGNDTNGAYGRLVLNADGSYTYTLNNFDPAVQGLDGDDILTEVFTYTITDGDGDPSETTLTITINGSDDPITINGLNVQAPELIVDEDDLGDGSSPAPAALTQTGSFTVNGTDGIASIKLDGTEIAVNQEIVTANGTFKITSISAPADGNATAITVGYSYVLTNNDAHPNADGENFLTEVFGIEVTDTDGSVNSDTIEVRIIDDVPSAVADGTFAVAEQSPLTFNALTNDVKGADGVDLAIGVAVETNPSKGTVVYNNDGTFTYTPNAGTEGPDSFTYTITDADGDQSTALVTFNLLADSVPNILRITNLTVDEDGLPNSNADEAPLQATPSETDSTESAIASGTAVVNFGVDVPTDLLASIKLLDADALDGQLKTLDGTDVVFALEGDSLVGRSGGAEVVRIEITGAELGPNPGDVTYSYSTTLSQPVQHGISGSEDNVLLTGISFEVTDSETDTATGSFDLTVVDDVPSLNVAKGEDGNVALATQDAETDGFPTAEDTATSAADFGGVFSLTSTAGADGAVAPSLSFTLDTAGGGSGLSSHGVAINLYKVGTAIVGSTAATSGAVNAGNTVFDVAVSGTGVVTLTQYQQVDHALPGEADGPYDDQFASLLDSAITLTASSSITDGDNDTASDSETVDIGANISFADDGPVLSNVAGNSSVTLDETTAGSPAGFGIAGISMTSAAAIVTATSAFGADGPAAPEGTTYTLSLAGDGTTTLKTAIGDFAIGLSLSVDGKTVTGSYTDGGLKTAFTATVNANGTLTVTQFVPLEHNIDSTLASGAHDDALTLTGLVNATIKITDFDGDTDSETVAIGDRVTFLDDGPSVMALAAGAVLVANDETATSSVAATINTGAIVIGNDPEVADAGYISTATSIGAVVTATPIYGADGAAATGSLSYALALIGSASGVTLTDGTAINLVQVGDVIVGQVAAGVSPFAGQAAFAIAISPTTGVVTIEQYLSLSHPTNPDNDETIQLLTGGVGVQVAVTDSDGDVASSAVVDISAQVRFDDDGPTLTDVSGGGSVTLDETGGFDNLTSATAAINFTAAFGADGPKAGSGTAYTLELTPGGISTLQTAVGNFAITLVQTAANVITGRYTDGTVKDAFTVTINTNGTVTVQQLVALEHNVDGFDAAAYDDALTLSGLITARVTITDGDNDATSATTEIGDQITFRDDGLSAVADTKSVDEGAVVNGNVLVDAADTFGQDGPDATTPAGGVVGVKAGSDTSAPVTTGTGTVIETTLGFLTLNANGTYSYDSKGNSVGTTAATDTFVYTIRDADGDTSTTTLTITINPVTLTGADQVKTVNEAALDLVQDAADLLPGLTTGSQPSLTTETVTGTLTATGASGAVTYTAQTVNTAYGRFVLNTDGTYKYTLKAQFDGPTTDNGTVTHPAVEVFTYTVTDANGNTDTGTVTIDVIDDVPTARADTDSVTEDAAQIANGNVLTAAAVATPDANGTDGVLDTQGADGASVTGVVFGTSATPVAGGVGGTVAGTYGSLTLAAGGGYTYTLTNGNATVQALGVGESLEETFTYTITDGDGDTSTTTLKITINGTNDLPTIGSATTAVSEEGLAGGLPDTIGTSPTADTTNSKTSSGTISVGDADGDALTVTLGTPAPGLLSGGGAVIWALTNGGHTLTGTVGATTVIVVTIDNAGNYNVDLRAPITHPDVTGTDAATLEDALSLVVPVSISDGTSTVNSIGGLSISIEDDSPSAVTAASTTVVNSAGQTSTASLDTVNGIVADNFGGDGAGKVIFTAATQTALLALNLTSGGATLSYTISGGGQILTAEKPDGTDVFIMTLQPAGSPNNYTIQMINPLDSFQNVVFDANVIDVVGGNGGWAGYVPNGQGTGPGDAPVNDDSSDLLVTPMISGVSTSTINTNANEIGIGGNFVDLNEGVRVDFVTDLTGSPVSGGSGNYSGGAANRAHVFDQHYQVNGASALFTAIQTSSTVNMIARDDNVVTAGGNDTNDIVGDGTIDNITKIAISFNNSTLLITEAMWNADADKIFNVGGQNFTVDFDVANANDVSVSGVISGTRLAAFTDSNYSSIEFKNTGGDDFKIGLFGAAKITSNPVPFTVPISIVDGDGDTVSSGSVAITATPAPPPVVLDLDGDGVEFVTIAAGVTFDYAGDGNSENTAWVGADDGLLAIDSNGDGIVNDGSEIVFGGNGLTDLQGLAANYDSNHDGQLTSADDSFALFGVWQDANSNGVTDAGEFESLTDAGIVSIGLVSDGIAYSAANGEVKVAGEALFMKDDGTTGIVADAAFATTAGQQTQSRTADEIRSGNLAMSVVAASLVSLVIDDKSAVASEGNEETSGHVVSELVTAPASPELLPNSGLDADSGQLALGSAPEFVQRTGEVDSTLRAEEQTDTVESVDDAPISQQSELLADSSEPQDQNDAGGFSGDNVMHNMLDMAAFAPAVVANDNSAISVPVEDAIRQAMPDMMVDRLIEAFSAEPGAPANDTGGDTTDGNDLLAGVLDQGIDTFHAVAMGGGDLLGSHQYDLSTTNNG